VSAWARPGVKCVCIEGGTPNSDGMRLAGGYPVTGGIYTVDGVSRDELFGKDILHLAEFPTTAMVRGNLRGWDAARFRPLVTRTQEQDVSLFTHLLDGLPVGADA